MDKNTQPAGERLAKRVAALRQCSRAEAERLIEGGWVTVDGAVADDPARRITHERVAIDPQGRPDALEPITLIWHKPAGAALQDGDSLDGLLAPTGNLRPWHLKHLRCVGDMPANSSGLAVFAQSPGVLRVLRESGPMLEHEWAIELAGGLDAQTLDALQARPEALSRGTQTPWMKLSVSSQNRERTRLRLAIKNHSPLRITPWLAELGLAPNLLHRLRLGRVALGQLAPGGWRALSAHERF